MKRHDTSTSSVGGVGTSISMPRRFEEFIVDDLFVGNETRNWEKFTTADGLAIDLRNISAPIVVFCSEGDNVTPPQQALGWILDLYDDVDEIRGYGQTIVYKIHKNVGHLGIFVSAKVARKEHDKFSSNIDLIDTLPPGLYEAFFEAKTAETASADLAGGDWIMRCEARTLDDLRALWRQQCCRRALLRGRSTASVAGAISRSTARLCSR